MNGSASRPPRLALALLRAAAPVAERPFVIADLEEEFAQLQRQAGRAAAVRWCWTQVALSMGPLLGSHLRALRVSQMFGGVAGDLRYTCRLTRRTPLVSASLVLAIAGGIGATTALVSVMEGVFLRPLPFTSPGRLVQLGTAIERFGRAPEMNFLDAEDIQRQSTTLAGLAQFDVGPGTVRFDADAPAVAATFLAAGRDLDRVLQIAPTLGRAFTPSEYEPGAAPVLLLTNRFWRSRFGADPAVVGRSIEIGSGHAEIVGVLPPAADRFPVGGSDVWAPLAFPADSFLNQRGSIALAAVGRLREGVGVDAAQAELAIVAARLALAHPETNRERGFTIDRLQDAMVGPVRPMMLILAGAIAVLLAVACANIANLLLAQSQARGMEFALRAAIGASRWRLARQLWTETLALFAIAGAGGILLSRPIARLLVARYPEALPLAADVTLDTRVVAVACGVTLLTALATGLPQARRGARCDITASLAHGTRATGDRRDRRLAAFFVAAQVALSTVLVFGGLVLLQTFVALGRVPPGFDADNVVAIRAAIPSGSRQDSVRMLDLQDALRDAAKGLPGISEAAHAMFIPFTEGSWGDGFRREGSADDIGPRGPFGHFFMVSPEYFRVMQVPILRGRALTAEDDERGRPVLVVSETFARQSFPGEDAIGRHITWNDNTWEIVGIARDMRHASLWQAIDRDVYVPRRQVPRGNTWLLLRTTRPASAVLIDLQRRARSIDPGILLSDALPMRERVATSAAAERFRALVTSALALLALALALVGMHGVVAYAVARRTREIGIRIALGQRPSHVRRAVILDAIRALVAGLVPGVLGSWLVWRWLGSVAVVRADLFVALASVAGIFLLAGTAAAIGPAWRASRVDPLVALRSE